MASPKRGGPISWSRSEDHVETVQFSYRILADYRGKCSTDHLVRVYDPERSGKLAMNDFYLMMKDLFINERDLMIAFPSQHKDAPKSLFEIAFSYRSINRAIERAMFEEVGLSRRLYESKCKNMYFTAELFWPILFLLNELGFIRAYRVEAPPQSQEEEAYFRETLALLKRLSNDGADEPPLAVSLRVPQRTASRAMSPDEARAELFSMDPSLVKMKIKAPIAQLFRDATSSMKTPTGKPPAVDPALRVESPRSDRSQKTPVQSGGRRQVQRALSDIFAHYAFPHQLMTLSQWTQFCRDFELTASSDTELRSAFRTAANQSSLLGLEGFLKLVDSLASKVQVPSDREFLAGRTYLKMGLYSGNVDVNYLV